MYTIPQWINTELPIVPKLAQLPSWLHTIEVIDPIRPNLASKIQFASTKPTKTDIAFLYLHGYSSSIREISPVTEMLAKQYHANIVFQRIARHGIDLAPMEYLTPQSWYHRALMGLAIANKIGNKVIIIGCSTGGTLSILLSTRSTAKTEFMHQVLIAPNCWPHPKLVCWLFTRPVIKTILENAPLIPLIGPNKNQTIRTRHVVALARSTLQEQNYTLRVPTSAISCMMQLVLHIWKINKHYPSLYDVPASIILSSLDKEVIYSKTIDFFKGYDAPYSFDVYNNSSHRKHHVIAGDICSPSSTEDIVRLVTKRLAQLVG